MPDKYDGITTAILLLEAARMMRYPDEVRRNLILARSALFDVLAIIDSMELTAPPTSSDGIATVTIRCPASGVEIPTDIKADEKAFMMATLQDNQIKCTSCGQWHQWSKVDAFLR